MAKGLCNACRLRLRRTGTVAYQGYRRYRYVGVPDTCPLTRAQLEVIQLLAEGKTRKQIGLALHVTSGGIRNRTCRACRLLGVITPAQAVIVCVREGWVSLNLQRGRGNREPPLTTLQRNYLQSFTALIQTSPTAMARGRGSELMRAIGGVDIYPGD